MKSREIIQMLCAIILFMVIGFCFSPNVCAAPGDVDLSFNAGVITSQFSQDRLTAIAVQPDGKILIGGLFNVVAGVPRNGLARLNADGSVDSTFVPPPFSQGDLVNPYKIAVQPDGKIVVAGNNFRISNTIYQLLRLNADGSLDASFSLLAINAFRGIEGLALQPDGKILIGGDFSMIGLVERRIVARLNSDGTLDTSFSIGMPTTHNGRAASFAIQPDGKIIAGGALFVTVGTTTFINVVRLNSNGTPDTTFSVAGDSLDIVQAVIRQSDGKILLAGSSSGNTGSRNSLSRVNVDGSLDSTFNSTVSLGSQLYDIVLEPTGKIIAVGNFSTSPMGQGGGIARFNTDGSRDNFYPFNAACGVQGFDSDTLAIVRQPDGKILVGGRFFNVSCFPRQRIARLQTDTNLTINNVTLSEGNSGTTAFTFNVNLSATSAQTVTVNYATANGTATAPVDYQTVSGSLIFAPGETAKTVTVSVNGDTEVETDETFTINLTGATNAIITGGVGTGTILNDDICAYSISPTSLNIGANGGAGNTIAVTTQAGCAYTAVSNNSFITINSGGSGAGNGTVVFTVAANSGAARTGTILVAGQTFTVNQAASATFRRTPFDFDGDGKADISVYRPSNGTWYFLNSTAGFSATQWGISTDKIVPADYDGDGKTDTAIYRPSNATWYLLQTTAGFATTQWGNSTDIPVPGDYDGDGKADIAIYRPSNGTWYILKSTGGINYTQFGFSTDIPVAGDYDGDGKADIAVFRPSNGTWYLLQTTAGFGAVQWGISTDKLVPADYDGDGKADFAVYRPSNGTWYLLQSNVGFTSVQWGIGSDIPVAADYDGDGKADTAIYRPSNGTWYLLQSTAGFGYTQFGFSTDKPVPSAFVP